MMKEYLNQAVYQIRRSMIREFSRLAKETPGCIALTLGEPDFDTPETIGREVNTAIENHETHYIPNNGSRDLLQAIARFEREKNGMDYTADEIIVTAGATEGLFTALFGILNPGDEVVIPKPAFVLYEEIVGLCRGSVVSLDTSPDHFQIRREKLEEAITERTKAIILNSPNNPTGCVLNEESLQAVYDAVRDRNIFVICDDVYRQLCYEGTCRSFTEYRDLRDKIILIQSFSKPYAMTGWRMGYMAMDHSIKERLELIHQYMVVSAPSLFQRAGNEALRFDPQPFLETYRQRREYVLSRLDAMGMEYTVPQGAFYVFPSIAAYGLSSSDFCLRMIREEKLSVTPGIAFGSDRHIRISYCCSDEDLREGMNRLERFIRKRQEEQ